MLLAHDRVVLIAQPQIEREVGTNLELILHVAHPERAPQLPDAQFSVHVDRIHSVLHEIVRTAERDGRDGDAGARVVQVNAPDVSAHLEGVAPSDDAQVIDQGERGADLQVELVWAEVGEAGHAGDSDRSGSAHGVMEGGTVHPELGLIDGPA